MCILCYKWRFLADYFYHYETVLALLAMLNLNYSNYLLDFQALGSKVIQVYLLFTIATRAELFVGVFSYGLRLFVGLHLVWAKPLSLEIAIWYIFSMLVSYFCLTLTNMLLIFFSEVYTRL